LSRGQDLSAAAVEPLLRGRFGRPYLWSASCGSTQDALRASGLPEGAVAVTEHQTSGRGRQGRRWEDTAGRALLLSVLLRPPPESQTQQLSLVAGLAVAEAIEEARDLAAIKWPNDVLLGGRKVAGILLESSGVEVVCGVGVNVTQTEAELPAETRLPAASLLTATGHEADRAELLASFLETLEHRYDTWRRLGLAPLLDELEARNSLRGHVVRVGGETGTVEHIAVDGRLALRRGDGTECLVVSGDVMEVQRRG
jgi:BirA family transcriptional regulator, biotin operon repressor / biotin---[acetyl-CoA-carboxylase] ligase